MPGGDGRAGMIAVILEGNLEDFDFKGLSEHFQRSLPSYAVPKFVRIRTDFEYTPTHKIKKVSLRDDGFDLNKISEPLYVLLPGDPEYKPLTKEKYKKIMEGKYRF
jgi:hypothetical protein